MRKLLVFCVALAALATSCDRELAGDKIEKIQEKGTLVVAVHKDDYPPMFMDDGAGNFVGIDVDIARDIAEELGVAVEFDRTSDTFNGVVKSVVDGRADIAMSWLGITLERMIIANATDPYFSTGVALLVRRSAWEDAGNITFRDIMEVAGVKVIAQKGASHADYIKDNYPNAVVITYDSDDEGIIDIFLTGEGDACITEGLAVGKKLKKEPDLKKEFRMVANERQQDPTVAYTNWEDYHFCDWINVYIMLKKDSGFLDEIASRYITTATE